MPCLLIGAYPHKTDASSGFKCHCDPFLARIPALMNVKVGMDASARTLLHSLACQGCAPRGLALPQAGLLGCRESRAAAVLQTVLSRLPSGVECNRCAA